MTPGIVYIMHVNFLLGAAGALRPVPRYARPGGARWTRRATADGGRQLTMIEEGRPSMSLSALLNLLLPSFQGTAYEPWAHAAVTGAVLWFVVARLVMHRDSRALAHTIGALVRQAYGAFDHAIQYAPAAERYRRRVAPYVELGISGFFTLFWFCWAVVFLVFQAFTLWSHSPTMWYQPALGSLFFVGCLVFSRLSLASATRAWQGIITGEEVTARVPRTRA